MYWEVWLGDLQCLDLWFLSVTAVCVLWPARNVPSTPGDHQGRVTLSNSAKQYGETHYSAVQHSAFQSNILVGFGTVQRSSSQIKTFQWSNGIQAIFTRESQASTFRYFCP